MSDSRRKLFEELTLAHAGDLFRFAFWKTRQTEAAEDLVQETFYEAWRSIGSLRDPARARAWLFQILRHRYAHRLRDQGRRPQPKISISEIEEVADPGGQDILSVLSRHDMLQRALRAVDDRYKEPFLMVFQAGFSCKETAEFLKIPLGTVLSRIHRARLVLRRVLHGFGMTNAESRPPRTVRPPGKDRLSTRSVSEDDHEER